MSIKISITTDNGKTGVPAFNMLPGPRDYYHGRTPAQFKESPYYNQVGGTCSHNCPGCYAMAVTRFPNVFDAYFRNTLIVKMKDFESLKQQLNSWLSLYEPRYFRIHDSGDFESLEYFLVWVEIIKAHPETIFYCYTKETEILRAAGFDTYDKLKKALPNLTANLSYWPGYCEDMLPGYPRFDYDAEKNMNCQHCPAVNACGHRTGITCLQCKHCMTAAPGSVRAVYPHK